MQLEVCGEPSLARATIVNYLRRKHRGAVVTIKNSDPPMPAQGLKIRMAGTDRWLYVALEAEAGAAVAEAIVLGAAAAVTFFGREDEFDEALQVLTSSRSVYLSEPAARWLAARVIRGADIAAAEAGSVQITPREREILSSLALGLTNDQIARALTISSNTVRSHLHSLATKLETSSRAALVHRARSLGLLDEAPMRGLTA